MNWDALDAVKFIDEREAVGALLKDLGNTIGALYWPST